MNMQIAATRERRNNEDRWDTGLVELSNMLLVGRCLWVSGEVRGE